MAGGSPFAAASLQSSTYWSMHLAAAWSTSQSELSQGTRNQCTTVTTAWRSTHRRASPRIQTCLQHRTASQLPKHR
eukprot:scaffold1220_cov376-Prasinococcus_capsulatus_cf.AAC.3